MQELGRKTNQQQSLRRSWDAYASDQHVERVWRAVVRAARTARWAPSALAAVPFGTPLSPARPEFGAVTTGTGSRRPGGGFPVINLTQGTAT